MIIILRFFLIDIINIVDRIIDKNIYIAIIINWDFIKRLIINNFKIIINNLSKFNLAIKITITSYLIIKIIDERLLLSNNLIIRDLFRFFFIAIIEINKYYHLIKGL